MCAAAAGRKPSPTVSIGPRATRHIWSGHRHGWCSGPRQSDLTPRDYSRGSWRISRTRRWGIAVVWGFIRLAKKYSNARMEGAAERALLTGACRYRSVASILKNSLDRQRLGDKRGAPSSPPPRHDNIRGAEYFE